MRWVFASLLVLSGCCVTKGEHKAFVQAARDYYQRAAPDVAAMASALHPLSREMARKTNRDFESAIVAAEERTR